MLNRLVQQKELPFEFAVHVLPLSEKGRYWQRLRTRALEMLCPDDDRPGTLQELSHAWRYERQQSFVAAINGFEVILAWCLRNGVDPAGIGEQPPSEQGLAELAAEIATAHLNHGLEQAAELRDLFREPGKPRVSTFSLEAIDQPVTPEPVKQIKPDSTGDLGSNPKVTVYCGARPGNSAAYTESTEKLGSLLAAADIDIVYGGGGLGLMGVLANTMLDSGGKVHGVVPRPMIEYEIAHTGLTTLHVTETLHERKALMAQLGDAFIALPGGIGTAEELMEILTWGQLGIHDKPCVLLNIEGFFNPLIRLLDHLVTTSFMSAIDTQRLVVVNDPMAAVDFFLTHLCQAQDFRRDPGVDMTRKADCR